MDMFLAPFLMVYIFHSLIVLGEYGLMLINNINLVLTAKLSKQGYRYHKNRKAFSTFYHRHSDLIFKYHIGFKTFCNKIYQSQYFMVI